MQNTQSPATQKPLLRLALIIRALRFPFISASLIPFIFGSLIDRRSFNALLFLLGALCVACAHLAANLINDYADSKSGADWRDTKFYGFFGGSKLIQEKAFGEGFYMKAAVIFLTVSLLSALLLFWRMKDALLLYFYGIIIFLGFSYSLKPLELSYRYLGEFAIFALFGPGLCMGGYYLQTGIFPDFKSFFLSLPLGLLVMNILIANEVPDFSEDKESRKLNLISLQGRERGWLLYLMIGLTAFSLIALNIAMGFLSPWAYLSFFTIPLLLKAKDILKKDFLDKEKLVESSKLTITLQGAASVILTLALFL